MTKRANNWPRALHEFHQAKRKAAFDWTTNNCGFFACDWIMKLTGIDPAAEYRPKVNSALSARHVIDAAGGIEQIASAAAKVHGWPECPVAYARRGDVVTIKIAGDIALGVCMGARSVYAGPHGVVSIATTECHKAWRIA